MSTASSATTYEPGDPIFLLVLVTDDKVTAKPYITEQGLQAGIKSIKQDFQMFRRQSGLGPDEYRAYRLHDYKSELIEEGSQRVSG